MRVTDELLLALADDELDADTAEQLRKAIAADPQLQEDYAVFEQSARLLREALDPGPVPERLIAAINAVPLGGQLAADPVVAPFAPRPSRARQLFPWGAMAASLALCAWALTHEGAGPGAPDVLAYASLPTGAEQRLENGATIRALGSYQTDAGLCRDLLTEASDRVTHDVLCQGDGGWQLALSLSAPAAQGYLPANDALTVGLDSFLAAIGAGSALTPEEEARALGP